MFPSIALPMFFASVDQTIIAAALPAIAAALGSVDQVAWVVVAYLTATTVAALIAGRLGDLLGRRRMLIAALILFTIGSVLCAFAVNVEMLIAMRILQGLGGGGLMTQSQALIGEAMPPRERARYQGYLAATAMTATALGPVAGGFLTEYFGWQSVFLVNLPFGVLALLLALRLPVRPRPGLAFRFDLPGVVLFAVFVTSATIALQQAQHPDLARLPVMAALAALALMALVLLVRQERIAPVPLLPLELLRRPNIWRCDIMAACHGARLLSLLTFLPIYLRVVHDASPVEIGVLMLPMLFSLGSGAITTARLVGRTGRTALFPSYGLGVAVMAMIAFSFWSSSMTAVQVAAFLTVTSFFMGTVMGVVQITVQSAAGPAMLGAGAATVQVSRSLGAALGTALVATILFATLSATEGNVLEHFEAIVRNGSEALAALSPEQRMETEQAVEGAFSRAFLLMAAFDAVAMVLAWTLPLRRI